MALTQSLNTHSTWPRLLHAVYNALLFVLFIVLFFTLHNFCYAQIDSYAESDSTTNLNEIGSGELLLHSTQSGTQTALLKSTKVEARVNGLISRVIVKQGFEKNSPNWVEGEYVFPLPTDSAVDYMSMIIGEWRVVGKIHEKQRAKKIYQPAKQAGKKATLVEQQRPNLFCNRVANIAPGESITVELQ